VIARIVDGSRVRRVQGALRHHAGDCGFAHLHGYARRHRRQQRRPVFRSAQKGAHFVELCSQRKIPLVFLQNITGFMVGKPKVRGRRHRQGRRQDGDAVATTEVPKITMIIGGSYGAGNYGMCGRAYAALPVDLAEQPHLRDGRRAGGAGVLAAPLIARYEKEAHAFYGSARLWDDGVIDPAQTRGVLALALSACLNRPIGETRFGVFRM
jgi:3-methylcrotonyl-CoA carboxylase beta subunit